MQNGDYRGQVTNAAYDLLTIREVLYTAILEILRKNELKDWWEGMGEDEEVEFSNEIFEGCDDANVRILSKVVGQVEKAYCSLVNLNRLEDMDVIFEEG
jgi:hypothetical protein